MIQFDGHTATVCSLAFSPDSMTLASGAKDGGVKLWDAAGGLVRQYSRGGHFPQLALAWSPGSDALFSGDEYLNMFRPSGAVVERCESVGFVGVTSIVFVSDNVFAVGTGKRNEPSPGGLDLWQVQGLVRKPISQVIGRPHGVRAIAAHSPTKRLHWIAGLPNTTACVWRSWCITSPNATDVKLTKPAADICVSPDGGTVAIASDWLVRVFTAAGKPKAELSGHKGQVAGVGFIHGGRTVVSASWDETVRFWDVATGQETARFALNVGKLTALAVSPDETRIAVGGTDGPVVVLDAE